MDIFTCVVVGEITTLLIATFVEVRKSNDWLAYMIFGVTGAIVGGRFPLLLGYSGEPTTNSVTIGLAFVGAIVSVCLAGALHKNDCGSVL